MSECTCQKCTWKSSDNEITAQQAREKTLQLNSLLKSAVLNRIFSKISTATESGLSSAEYEFSNEERSVDKFIIKHLTSLGYRVKHHQGSDYYGDSYIEVSW